MSVDVVLECSGLTKVFKSFWGRRTTTLNRLDLSVKAGETFGMLGANGAGKTTSQKLFLGLLRPSAGSVKVLGHSPDDPAVRARIGFLPENPYFYTYLTGREFLELCADLFSLTRSVKHQRVASLLQLVRMEEAADQQMRRYSKGMLQRIGIAQALINDPELVFLDEPTSGLDPLGHRQITEIILALKAQRKTLIFNSHVMNDVQALCDRIGILHRGRLVACGTLPELLAPEEDLEAFFVRTVESAEALLRTA
jgi:ABC-2 type transport system ATP-binding protein